MKWIISTLALIALIHSSDAQSQYTTRHIAYYQYSTFSSSDEAAIDLFDNRGNQIGIAVFLPLSPASLPAATLSANDGLVRLYYPTERLHDTIDLLRNESPLVIRYWHGIENNSHIGTYKPEPIGEAE